MNLKIKAVCLCLDKRQDIWTKLEKTSPIKFDKFIVGDGSCDLNYDLIDTEEYPTRYDNSTMYPTWYSKNNAYKAWKSHKAIFNKFLDSNYDTLLLMEDDAVFENDFIDIYNQTLSFFKSNPWDCIYYGWYSNGHLTPTDHEHIYKMNGGAGFHGVLLQRHVIEFLSQLLPYGPFDWLTSEHIHPRGKCYAIYPNIISQLPGHSYVEGVDLNKPDRFKK